MSSQRGHVKGQTVKTAGECYITSNVNTYRRDVYLVLSEALKEPRAEFWNELPEITVFLQEAFCSVGYDVSQHDYHEWPTLAGELASLRQMFHQSFMFPPESRVIPVESIYRQWTIDPTAQVPFAQERGYFCSDAATHMFALYDMYGLTIPDPFQAVPDHLCLELEFAAHLLDQQQEDRLRIFLDEHLDWVEELRHDAGKMGIAPFYRQVIGVTAQFLANERKRSS